MKSHLSESKTISGGADKRNDQMTNCGIYQTRKHTPAIEGAEWMNNKVTNLQKDYTAHQLNWDISVSTVIKPSSGLGVLFPVGTNVSFVTLS
jgi:hypothetical protein